MQYKNTHKMFEDKIDKLYYDKFANQSIDSKTNEWNSLQEKLNPTKPSTGFSKYLLAFYFLLLTAITCYFIFNKNSNNIQSATNNNQVEGNTILANAIATNTEKSTLSIEDNTLETDKNKLENKNLNIQANNNKINSEVKSINSSTSVHNEQFISANKFITKTNSVFTKTTKVQRSINLNKKNSKSKKENIKILKNNNDLLIENYDEENNTVENKNNIENQTNKTAQNIDANTTYFDNNNTVVNVPKMEEVLPKKEIIESTSNVLGNKVANNPKPKKQKRQRSAAPEHSFENEKIWFVEAFTGMTNSSKNQNSFSAFLAPNGYNNMRLNQETSLSTISAGVNFSIRQKHITVSSGINYLQLGDNVNYNATYNSNSFVKNANGKTNFTYIEIPVVAGYEVAYKRWGFNIKGGISAGILTQLSGEYVSINNFNTSLYDVKANKSNFRNTLLNAIISPQVCYYFNEKSNLFVATNYRRNLQPITNANSDLKQKYNVIGFSVGIRTKLK